jgi:hypothetical protein
MITKDYQRLPVNRELGIAAGTTQQWDLRRSWLGAVNQRTNLVMMNAGA